MWKRGSMDASGCGSGWVWNQGFGGVEAGGCVGSGWVWKRVGVEAGARCECGLCPCGPCRPGGSWKWRMRTLQTVCGALCAF